MSLDSLLPIHLEHRELGILAHVSHYLISPAHGRLRQQDFHKLKAILGNLVSTRMARAIPRFCLNKT